MPLTVGTRLGPYEIQAPLGAGGMGEVYRARDTKLNRDVALKVLPEAVALDPDRIARFKREAHVLASLNHPNIAAIYGFEESDGIQALVLELVEGPTLADLLERRAGPSGPAGLPIDEALSIAKQIAEALEAAHEHGIIHRDLKPANVKVKDDGTVKVLDFGLAKALHGEAAAADVSHSPTLSVAATRAGVILGTAAYMSPEQARGRAVDKRSDIWAFGCVLYELLTGRRAFGGGDVTDILARVIEREPDWSALPGNTPQAIRRLLRRCMAKDRRQRLTDAAGLRLDVDEAQTAPADAIAALPSARAPTWRRAAVPLLTLLVGSVLTGIAVWLTTRPAPPRVTRLTIVPPATAPLAPDGYLRDVAIAPDGTRVAYVGAGGTLVVRALDALAPTVLGGLGAPRHPTFSPDGQWIAFFDGNTSLKKVAVTGGPAVTLARTSAIGVGLSWGTDDTIIFATGDGSTGLLRIGAAGGEPAVLTTPDRSAGEVEHIWPEALPGGEAVLFTIAIGGIGQSAVAVLDLTTGTHRVLVSGASHAQYVAPGYLVYVAAGTLRAVRFDRSRLEVVGTPVPVVEGVATILGAVANASVTADGTLVYVPLGAAGAPRRTLVWVDRQGRETAVGAPPRAYVYPRLSPDGKQVAVFAADQEQDLWLWDMGRPTLTRATFDPAVDFYPVWTPDGRRLVWASQREGAVVNLYTQAADGTGAVERLTESANNQFPTAMTPDGKRVVLREDTSSGTGTDVTLLTLDGVRQVTPLVATVSIERNGEVSSDGRWLAYESDESGQLEVYVRPFPEVNAGKWQVSTGGGRQPLWDRGGRQLSYRGPDGAVLVVTVEGDRARFGVGPVTKVADARYYNGAGAFVGRTYDISLDGQRFLMIKEAGDAQTSTPPHIVVVQNWAEELRWLVPTN
jgi:serine/threonine-protein kinase